jgi:hypothetical protein
LSQPSNASDKEKPHLVDFKIGYHPTWVKEKVHVNKLKPKNTKTSPEGSKSHGPLIVDSDYSVLDGNHRLREAKARGDTHVEVYRPGRGSLKKAETHPHLKAHGPELNEQAGGNQSGHFHDVMGHYGTITPGKKTNLKFYHGIDEFQPKIDQHLKETGYTPYLAGGKHGKPDLANKNYTTKHLMIYDPSEGSGGDYGNESFTSAWRKIHEKAHADTLPEVNKLYGEGRRLGKLGVRTPREMARSLVWEHLAAHKQRDLMEQLGHKMSEEDFAREYNTVMGDALIRSITGKFSDPHEMGFYPHSKKVPLEHTLGILDQHAKKLGLRHQDDSFARQKAEGVLK